MSIQVETFDGTMALKRDCRFIKGEFYIKNKQCFQINDVWYRVNSGFIDFDYSTKQWVITKDNPQLINGIVDFNMSNGEAILGKFTPDQLKNVNIITADGRSFICIDHRILPDTLFIEDVASMGFISVNHPSAKKSNSRIPNINFGNHGYPFKVPYCTRHYEKEMYDKFKIELSNKIHSTRLSRYYNELGNYSFGFEFETSKGKIPNYKILTTGLLPLRDGSITGIEFATLPLQGRDGVIALENICKELSTYTTFSTNESLHLHIGNVPTTKKYVGYLYTLCCLLENEIFSLFPKYYAQTSKFKQRGKDYNMPLRKEFVTDDPEETFNNLAFYLSDGKKYQGFGHAHPSDPNDEQKWGIQCRYHLINFISLLFGNNKTLEFRCHVPTRDPIKVLSWLYICAGIIKYADIMCKKNVPLATMRFDNLKVIMNEVYSPRLSSYLVRYIDARKHNRMLDDQNGDFIGETEIGSELKNKPLYKDID